MAKELRSGYTTGACAAAGVKACFLFQAGEDWNEIALTALDGTPLVIPVKAVVETPDGVRAEVLTGGARGGPCSAVSGGSFAWWPAGN